MSRFQLRGLAVALVVFLASAGASLAQGSSALAVSGALSFSRLSQTSGPDYSPALNEEVFLVVRLRLDRLDFQAASPWFEQRLTKLQLSPQTVTQARSNWLIVQFIGAEIRTRLMAMGVREAYLIFSTRLIDLPTNWVLAFPLDEVQSRQVATAFSQIKWSHARLGNVSLVGPDESVQAYRTMTASVRKDISDALKLDNTSALTFAYVPSEHVRDFLERRIPQQELFIEAEIAVFTRGISRAIATVDFPPTFAMRARLDAATKNDADSLNTWIGRALDGIRTSRLEDPRAIEILTPRRRGQMFTLEISDAQLDRLLSTLIAK